MAASKKKTTKVGKGRKSATKKIAKKRLPKITEKFTKSRIVQFLSEQADVSKKEVTVILDALSQLIEGHVSKGGPGEFTLPGLMKITTKHKPARKARKGVNPFTGEEIMLKAKPASKQVKIRALKTLKEMAN